MNTLLQVAALLNQWLTGWPTKARKVFYKAVKIVSALATLALLLLPALPSLGVTLPANVEYGAILTGALTFLGHLADSHTTVDQYPDYPVVDAQDSEATEPSTATT